MIFNIDELIISVAIDMVAIVCVCVCVCRSCV